MVIYFGPFQLDTVNKEISRSGQPLDLTQKPFDVLLYLIENRNRYVPADELHIAVWGSINVGRGSRKAAIHQIREALGDHAGLIQNRHGFGYRFVGELMTEGALNIPETTQSPYLSRGRSKQVLNFKNEEEQSRYYLQEALAAEQQMKGAGQVGAFTLIEQMHEELLTSIDYFERVGKHEEQLRLASALGLFWNARGGWSEGREILLRALSRYEHDNALRAKAYLWAGHLATHQHDFPDAEYNLKRSRTIAEQIGQRYLLSHSSLCLAFMTSAQGKFEESTQYHEVNLRIAAELQNDWLTAASYRGLGFIAQDEGRYEDALKLQTEALTLTEKIGDEANSATCLDRLAVANFRLKRYDEAEAIYHRALVRANAMKKADGQARCNIGLGRLYAVRNEPQKAAKFFESALISFRTLGSKRQVATVMEEMGRLAASLGKTEDAARMYGSADRLRQSIKMPLVPSERAEHASILQVIESLPAWAEAHEWAPERLIDYIKKAR